MQANLRHTPGSRLLLVFGLLVFISISAPVFAGIPLLGSDGNPSLAPLMKQVTPAVVNIAVRSRIAAPDNPLLRDPFFRRFFNLPERLPPRERASAGSGVIVDAQRGYVLTNNHVVENAAEITVTLKDRRELQAQLIGRDAGTDIALLKVDAPNLSALPFGNSDKLEVGDFVIAIGNPFGIGQTVTSGIVSALGRAGLNVEGYEDFIQTDASINPGNSGGALVNLKGELIGINTAIIGPSGGNVGIGFAVPSNMARSVMDQLIGYGKVQRGQLGIVIQSLTPDLARALGVNNTRGAVVTQVGAGTAAERAGIRAGDIIIAVDGRQIRNSGDLRNRIGLVRAGTEVELTLLREGRRITLRARVGHAHAQAQAQNAAVAPGSDSVTVEGLAGASLRDDPNISGIVVTAVENASPAASYGLRAGDIIVLVNRKPVNSIAELRSALAPNRRVTTMNIRRGNAELFIVLR